MGLVIGVSACVGVGYAINKKRKSRKKKKLAQEAENLRNSGAEEGEYDEQGEEYQEDEFTVQIHHDVIVSDIGYSESLRKRKRGRSVESENSSKAKTHKETTRRKKLQEEADKVDVTDKTGSLRDQRSNGTPTSKTKKNYKHVELSESTSEDEGVDVDKARVYVRSEHDDSAYESEEVYPITRNLRLSIRQSESGNTVFKIYASEKKTDNTNLRNTTDEITV